MTEPEEEPRVDDFVRNVDMSNTSTTKFNPLRDYLSVLLDIPPDDIYVVGSSTRASNIPIRLVQGKAKDRHHALGVAVIGTDEMDLAKKHAADAAQNNYDSVAVIAKRPDGNFDVRAFAARIGTPASAALAKAFPHADATNVAKSVDHSASSGAEAKASPVDRFVSAPIDSLAVDQVRAACSDAGLIISDEVVLKALAALRAKKHLLLSGPPGTGKTTFAEALSRAAAAAGVCAGHIVTTATSDWTSVDTVGGYRQTRERTLEFHPGLIVEAVESCRWAVIDEFNRADIDKAIGQLFTLLSGNQVVLPFERGTGDNARRIALVPEGLVVAEQDNDTIEVDGSWRLIATMNETDLDLLYTVSQALKRRFAIIEIPVLEGSALAKLLARVQSGNDTCDLVMAALAASNTIVVGPALWTDACRYLQERVQITSEIGTALPIANILKEALELLFVPQGISEELISSEVRKAIREVTGDTGTDTADLNGDEDDDDRESF